MFEHLLGAGEGQSHPVFKAQYPVLNDAYSVPDLVVPVHCSLTELFNGCTKTLSYQRRAIAKDGKNAEFVGETKTITLLPGDGPKSPLVFPQQGHHEPGHRQSLLVFNIV